MGFLLFLGKKDFDLRKRGFFYRKWMNMNCMKVEGEISKHRDE